MFFELVGMIVSILFIIFAFVYISSCILDDTLNPEKDTVFFSLCIATILIIIVSCCFTVDFKHNPEKYGYTEYVGELEKKNT